VIASKQLMWCGWGGVAVTCGMLLLSNVAHAQAPTPPVSAGSLLEEVERQRPPSAAPRQGPALNVPQPMAPSAAPTAEFTVKQFTFTGNTKVRSATLEAALAGYLNREIQFKDLQEAANVVADTYAEQGWLARAFVPRQDITEGTVRIHIIEAVYGGSRIDGEVSHASLAQIQGMVDAQNRVGEALSLVDVERGLLIADDLPGVSVVGSLVAGENTQETDVLINVEDTQWITGRVQVDDQGNKSTGENEVSVNTAINGLTGHGDQFTAYGLYTEGLSFVSVGYSVPLSDRGLRLGTSYSTLGYRIVDKDLAAVEGSGFANTWGFDLTQPLIRSRNTNVTARLGFTNKLFENRASGVSTSEHTVEVVALNLTATHLDSWGGGGYTALTLTPSMGHVDYGLNQNNQRLIAATTESEGRYSKLRYSLSRQQNLPANFSLYANLRGQFASKNLDSSERFYLGGPYGVRAYPNNEGGGSQGTLFSFEVRYNVMPELQLAAFYDVGEVQVNKFNDIVGAADPNLGKLEGAGLTVTWSAPYNILLNATWARRIGNNPFANDRGLDSDGSLSQDRFWLNASIGF